MCIKMSKQILTFDNIEVSNKISFGEKNYRYFIGYLYNGNNSKPWNIML